MARPSWHLDRRTFLRGAGLSLALPWLEAMAQADPPAERPKRFCAFFFGNGVALPEQESGRLRRTGTGSPTPTAPTIALTKLARTAGAAPERHDHLRRPVASHQPLARRAQHRRRLAHRGRHPRQSGELDLDRPGDRPPRRRPDAHPLAGPFEPRRRRHQEPIDHDLLRRPGPGHSRRVDAAPHLRTPVRAARRTATAPRGSGPSPRDAAASISCSKTRARCATTSAGPISSGSTNSCNRSARSKPGSRAPRTGSARRCRRSIVEAINLDVSPQRTDRLHPHHVRPDRPRVRDRHDARRRLSDLRRRRRRHLRSLPVDPRHRPRRASRPQPRQTTR